MKRLKILSAFLALASVSFGIWAQAPVSIAGMGIEAVITSGNYPFASYGSFFFLPSSSGNSYWLTKISGPADNSYGSYSWSRTSTSSGTLAISDNLVGQAGMTVTFSSSTMGTYRAYHPSFPSSYQAGTFRIYSGAAPATIRGWGFRMSILAGAYPFATYGNYQFLPGASGNTYQIIGGTGVANSYGSYSFFNTSYSSSTLYFTDSGAVSQGDGQYIGTLQQGGLTFYIIRPELTSLELSL